MTKPPFSRAFSGWLRAEADAAAADLALRRARGGAAVTAAGRENARGSFAALSRVLASVAHRRWIALARAAAAAHASSSSSSRFLSSSECVGRENR